MRIRAVTAADTDALILLWREVFPEYDDPQRPQRDPRANIERKLAYRDGLFWLAQVDTAIVGSAMAGYDGHRGWIYSIGIALAHRRRGIGHRLLVHAEAALRERGCPKVNLQVLTTRAEALDFWQAAGYGADPVHSLGKRLV